jgi:pyruvyltransferase
MRDESFVKKKLQKIMEIAFRQSIILNVIDYKARKNRINLNWAPVTKTNFLGLVMLDKTDRQNLGDYLAMPIYDYMLEINNLDRNKKVKKTIHLYTIGSILLIGHQDATIWGSGILMGEPEGFIWNRNKYRKLDVRCVRGPLTKKRLEENGIDVSSCKFGDPGVLMPLIYQPKVIKENEYGVILHMSSADSMRHEAEYEKHGAHMIDILTDDYKKTIDEICKCKLVISNSLHGIILAESYGIPAILLRKFEFDDFKYKDYYLSTGRSFESIACADSIDEALSMRAPEVPDISELQNNLLSTFPVDLWE